MSKHVVDWPVNPRGRGGGFQSRREIDLVSVAESGRSIFVGGVEILDAILKAFFSL